MSAPAPKPFSLQAPERIAMEYGGNKQKIAQAVQSGLIDPTSGLLAGMFIDRMRSAQVQEQAPNKTVAQQVLGPQGPQGGPPPPGGPQGGPPPGGPPPQGAPQGGPPPGGPPPPPPPQGGPPPQGPVGMAEGGLTSLPVPDYMFDEHTFAGGGIVAFATGDEVSARAERLKVLMATMGNPNYLQNSTSAERQALSAEIDQLRRGKPYVAPDLPPATENTNLLAGMFSAATDTGATDEQRNAARQAIYANAESQKQPEVITPAVAPVVPPPPAAAPRPRVDFAARARDVAKAKNVPIPTARPDLPTDAAATPAKKEETLEDMQARVKKLYGDVPTPDKTSAEDKAARKKEDLYSALMQAGFSMMAGTSQNALTNIGEGFKAAMPTMQASLKERRADEKEERAQAFAAKIAAHTDNVSSANAAYTMYYNANKDKQAALEKQLDREVQREQIAAQLRVGLKTPEGIALVDKFLNATPGERELMLQLKQAGSMYGADITEGNSYLVEKGKIDAKYARKISLAKLKKDEKELASLIAAKQAEIDALNLVKPKTAQKLNAPTGKTQQIGRFAVSESGN